MAVERRVPAQSRSREKYERILETAKELIGSKGNDSVSMREIAKTSGVALGSIYQYFPDKNAILGAIMESYFAEIRKSIERFLSDSSSIDDIKYGIKLFLKEFYMLFQKEPVLAMLWAGLQANAELRDLDAKDSYNNAKFISRKLCELLGPQREEEIFDAVFLLLIMAGPTFRTALSMSEDKAERVIREYEQLVIMRLNSFA